MATKTKKKKDSKRSSDNCECPGGLEMSNIERLTQLPGMVGQFCNKCLHVLNWDFGTYVENQEPIEVKDDNVVFTLPDEFKVETVEEFKSKDSKIIQSDSIKDDLSTICVQVLKVLAIEGDNTSMGFYVDLGTTKTLLVVPSKEKKVKAALDKPSLIESKWATIEVFEWSEEGVPTSFEVKQIKAKKS